MRSKKAIYTLITLFTIVTTHAFAADNGQPQNRGKHQGPPPEAYTACKDKNVGDTAQFVSPRGDTVVGQCERQGDKLVLRPERMATGQGGRHQGPPPEAYATCKDKKVGDTAQFVSPQGDTVTGTCQKQGDRLLLRPDHPPRNKGERSQNRPMMNR